MHIIIVFIFLINFIDWFIFFKNYFFVVFFSSCHSTASNSTRSTPTCSPVLRKRSRSPLPPSADGENMVEKSSDHSSDKSPSTPEQTVQRPYSQSVHSTRTGNKNSKVSTLSRTHTHSRTHSHTRTHAPSHALAHATSHAPSHALSHAPSHALFQSRLFLFILDFSCFKIELLCVQLKIPKYLYKNK